MTAAFSEKLNFVKLQLATLEQELTAAMNKEYDACFDDSGMPIDSEEGDRKRRNVSALEDMMLAVRDAHSILTENV